MRDLDKALDALEQAQKRCRENRDIVTACQIQQAMAYIQSELCNQVATALRDRKPMRKPQLRLVK
jgi:hypothetical protein